MNSCLVGFSECVHERASEAGTSGGGSLTAPGLLAKSKIHTSSNPLPGGLEMAQQGPIQADLTA
ncbi:hypothetical protein NK6_63 [Bradyrhizobium diazoefficiens]|uniref:Uncharacterized protein n=1 Tax=Bradyrhizobium diazoefficiens TaxID=1355477 RepID=A0A0E3VS42_9BRAD|nr:hypothetical protein NK6_63 [Bradyrhizobium diazoefficiens]